jgi:hypothetical protein
VIDSRPGGPDARHVRRAASLTLAIAAMAMVVGVGARDAAAGDNDLVVARLSRILGNGSMMRTVGQNAEFRSLASELGVVLAPRLLTPSDTLGFGGFQFTADFGYTKITKDASWWRALEGSPPDFMSTVGFFARKGMWLPLPSFEIGAGAVHVLDSHLWTGQLYAKFGVHEGFHSLPIPSVAVRGSVSRLLGEADIDLTIVGVDISISKRFGIGGTWHASPYLGWNFLIIIPRSEVLDPTPNVDPLMPGNERDGDLNFVFEDQDDIVRNRLFAGVKLQYYVFQLTVEGNLTLEGSSVDDRSGTTDRCELISDTENCDAKDGAGSQTGFSFSAGLDF